MPTEEDLKAIVVHKKYSSRNKSKSENRKRKRSSSSESSRSSLSSGTLNNYYPHVKSRRFVTSQI